MDKKIQEIWDKHEKMTEEHLCRYNCVSQMFNESLIKDLLSEAVKAVDEERRNLDINWQFNKGIDEAIRAINKLAGEG